MRPRQEANERVGGWIRPSGWIRRRGWGAPALILVGLPLLVAGAAPGASGSRQSAELTFTKERPHRATGLWLRINYVNPDDPEAKPPAVRKVVETLAPGTKIDTSVPEQCGASDAQLMAQGPSACPAGSRVGGGFVSVDTGIPGPARFVEADTVFLNNENELILVSTVRGSGARVVTRAAIEGRTITTELATLPGTPPDGGSIDRVRFRLDRITTGERSTRRRYIRTPADCPGSGEWMNRVRFTYDDGVSQLVRSPSPCTDD